MAYNNNNKNVNEEVKVEVKQEVKEVLVEVKKDTSTKPTTFEERAKIEAEVTMVKIGKDASGKWIFKRSDRINDSDKKKRQETLENIRKGLKQ